MEYRTQDGSDEASCGGSESGPQTHRQRTRQLQVNLSKLLKMQAVQIWEVCVEEVAAAAAAAGNKQDGNI